MPISNTSTQISPSEYSKRYLDHSYWGRFKSVLECEYDTTMTDVVDLDMLHDIVSEIMLKELN